MRRSRGEEDPERIWGAHNAISLPESLDDIDGDVVLFPWNARGMPLVFARPSGWGVDQKELEGRQAMGLEGLKNKEPKELRGRKAKSPAGRKVKDRKGRKAKEPKQQAPQTLSL